MGGFFIQTTHTQNTKIVFNTKITKHNVMMCVVHVLCDVQKIDFYIIFRTFHTIFNLLITSPITNRHIFG